METKILSRAIAFVDMGIRGLEYSPMFTNECSSQIMRPLIAERGIPNVKR